MDYNVLRRRDFAGGLTDEALKTRIQDDLARDGWTLLRGFQPDMAGFAGLVGRLCRRVGAHPRAVGPARRQYPARAVSSAVGMHRAARASEPRARRATSAPTSTKDAPASM